MTPTKVPTRDKDDWEMDTKSYVLIRISNGQIEVGVMKVQEDQLMGGFVKSHEELARYSGEDPEDLYYKIIKDGWITNMQHAAYLGSELRKAYIAIKKKLKYMQDSEL
ncbi:DUF4346 domain-containing protein [Candidatus Woesearchaeota archaeon]|nr:DUF4346 domain-containing protein [Candidatus Woesearchaeota archaeon]